MNYQKDHVIYYNDWLSRNFPSFKINYYQIAQVDNNYTKIMTGDGYSLTLITDMI